VSPTQPATILTVGHSTHPIQRFVALLGGAHVKAVADVRRFPGSRRNPHFGAEALAAELARAGTAYESFAEALGGRRSPSAVGARPEATHPDNSAWRNPSFRAYADYMSDPAFAAGVERLEALARSCRTAVMCAEAHPSRCHRQLIADALVARDWRVVHLLGDGRLVRHAPPPHAVIQSGRVSYPGGPSAVAGSR
jgi:uncharacterized protein (DUF488 family)